MACRELAALRLGMMGLLGVVDEAQRQHDLAELGDAAHEPGPLKAMAEARNLKDLVAMFQASLADLEEKVAHTSASDAGLNYYRSLLLVNRRVEQDLQSRARDLGQMWRDLDVMHDVIHEIYPVQE